MQLHELQLTHKRKKKKRIGRGGKRGTYSGKGVKGQKARAGAGVKPGFRGGDTPIWKLFPKKRGASTPLEIKKRGSRLHRKKPAIVNIYQLNRFRDGETVTPQLLKAHGLVDNIKYGVKILGEGKLERKLVFKDVSLSKSVKQIINK